jgi:hypothetical protein
MSESNEVRREDADYALWRSEGSDTFAIEDKRTGHRIDFNDCVPHGYGGYVFLYHYPGPQVDDPSRTISYKSAYLDKSSLPNWLVEEFEHIYECGGLTPATDPRGGD